MSGRESLAGIAGLGHGRANRRVLLVDDMPSIHQDFRNILQGRTGPVGMAEREEALFGAALHAQPLSFDLDCAGQGEEGLVLVETAIGGGRPYALAFVDMRMPPGWDGLETIEQLWRVDARLQVVLCTAYSDHSWEQLTRRLEVKDRLLILKKPFDAIEVRQLASTLSTKWELTQQAAAQMEALEETVQELKATEAALRASNRELEAFASSLSHDLRTPMGVVNLFSNLLEKELGAGASEKVAHYLARIRSSAAVGEQLIEDLLSLSRITRFDLQRAPVDLSTMAREIVEELRATDRRREFSVAIEDRMVVSGDARLLRMALRDLLQNAWKFSAATARALVEVGSQPGEGEPVFFVRDNGSGFDMAHAARLFGIFERLHSPQAFPGSGAGLARVSRVIARHGGRIWAESRPGEGATFYFSLPPQRA